jgi:hypothetical protein
LGLQIQAPDAQMATERLAICSVQELSAIVSVLQGAIPVITVLFELGRQGGSFTDGKISVSRLADIQHHARLQNIEQVISSLTIIDEALHRVRSADDGTVFYGVDSGGHCFIALQTQQNILRLWQAVANGGQLAADDSADSPSSAANAFAESAFARQAEQPVATPLAEHKAYRMP